MTARKIVIDGITFDSLAEGRRYQDLKLLERAGAIKDLRCHTTYMLQEGFVLPNGKKIRQITWTDDFSYMDCETGQQVVEDVKGFQRQDNKLRHKLFMKKFNQEVVLIRNY